VAKMALTDTSLPSANSFSVIMILNSILIFKKTSVHFSSRGSKSHGYNIKSARAYTDILVLIFF
jgi:hypothetical protein